MMIREFARKDRRSRMKQHVWMSYRQENKVAFGFHSHTHYEIFYFHEGKCNYLIGDKIYVLQPGDLIIMNGMTLHRPFVTVDPYIRSVVHFQPGFAQKLFQFSSHKLNMLQPFHDLRNHRVHLTEEQRAAFEATLEKMYHSGRGDEASDTVQYQLSFMELIFQTYRLFEQEMRQRTVFHSLKEEHTQRIIQYIEEHLLDEIHLHHLEEELHLNRYYLAKTFKEVTGTTIFQYLSERRINEAKMLILLQPELSITEVSYRAGFKHLSHFSRIFKKTVGVTAEQYRKQAQADTNES